jgi:hypothetical protein
MNDEVLLGHTHHALGRPSPHCRQRYSSQGVNWKIPSPFVALHYECANFALAITTPAPRAHTSSHCAAVRDGYAPCRNQPYDAFSCRRETPEDEAPPIRSVPYDSQADVARNGNRSAYALDATDLIPWNPDARQPVTQGFSERPRSQANSDPVFNEQLGEGPGRIRPAPSHPSNESLPAPPCLHRSLRTTERDLTATPRYC